MHCMKASLMMSIYSWPQRGAAPQYTGSSWSCPGGAVRQSRRGDGLTQHRLTDSSLCLAVVVSALHRVLRAHLEATRQGGSLTSDYCVLCAVANDATHWCSVRESNTSSLSVLLREKCMIVCGAVCDAARSVSERPLQP